MNHRLPHTLAVVSAAVLMALGLFVLSGCSSLKKTQASGAPQNATARERVDSLAASYAEWSTVSMPVRLSISEPKQFSVTAQCVMRRNAYVSMSVRMLGFEVASVWIDNDSVHAVDKYHKRYLSEDFRRFMGGCDNRQSAGSPARTRFRGRDRWRNAHACLMQPAACGCHGRGADAPPRAGAGLVQLRVCAR